jgi:hypothetical protein
MVIEEFVSTWDGKLVTPVAIRKPGDSMTLQTYRGDTLRRIRDNRWER